MWHPEYQEGANLVKVGQKKHPMEKELLVPRPCGDQEIVTCKGSKEDNMAEVCTRTGTRHCQEDERLLRGSDGQHQDLKLYPRHPRFSAGMTPW